MAGPREGAAWSTTLIGQTLRRRKDPEAKATQLLLDQCMPAIEGVLASGGTAPTDFTLHDAGHALRVAHRMGEVIPKNVLQGLASYELGLLILAAHLHDIGMTPTRRKVTAHHRHLLTGDPGELTANEQTEFRAWLDGQGVAIAEPGREVTHDILRRADFTITHYCRYRHNDWSEEWMRQHLSRLGAGLYNGWLEDLIGLCRSHHEGYEELASPRFDPRPVGRAARVVHLRYLASVLRVADILEFDPERTPEVVFQHRDVSPESAIYWWKDHEITAKLDRNRLVIYARPTTATIQRAIEQMMDEIEAELRLVRRLADETHFDRCPGLTQKTCHRWDLLPYTYRDIRPRTGTYEYMDGGFRPNTNRLLQLLGSSQLYSTPLVAVREMLQNAFDAVRQQIAYERLARRDPADPAWNESLGERHLVSLRLEGRETGTWLVCRDTGIGMTKEIVRDRFLVSGARADSGVIGLERRCREAGFELGRTGEFGIGVLSYFMLGDHVTLETRRSQAAGDDDGTGWRFDTSGVGTFGELRRQDNALVGTTVALRLTVSHDSDWATWWSAVITYVRETIAFAPCRVEVESALEGGIRWETRPGWTTDSADIVGLIRAQIEQFASGRRDASASDLMTARAREELLRRHEEHDAVVNEAMSALHWIVEGGLLPDGAGQYRLHLPYFRLRGGTTLGYLRVTGKDPDLTVKDQNSTVVFFPAFDLRTSWRGVSVSTQLQRTPWDPSAEYDAFVELDFVDRQSGEISVDRDTFRMSNRGRRTREWTSARISDLQRELTEADSTSLFANINYRLLDESLPANIPFRWVVQRDPHETEPNEEYAWNTVHFPVTDHLAGPEDETFSLTYQGESVTRLFGLRSGPRRHMPTRVELSWCSLMVPDRMVVIDYGSGPGLARLWHGPPRRRRSSSKEATLMDCQTKFPPNWSAVCGARYFDVPGRMIWNPNHRLVKCLDESARSSGLEYPAANPLLQREQLITSPALAAEFVARTIVTFSKELWAALVENDPALVQAMWRGIFGDATDTAAAPLVVLGGDPGNIVSIISPEGWTDLYEASSTWPHELLPPVDAEWRAVCEFR